MRIYRFNAGRNKKGISMGTMKRELIKFGGPVCSKCQKMCNPSLIKMNHITPVCLMGPVTDFCNTQLLCKRCHNKKTAIDRIIINDLIRNKILWHDILRDNGISSLLSREELKDHYERMYALLLRRKQLEDPIEYIDYGDNF